MSHDLSRSGRRHSEGTTARVGQAVPGDLSRWERYAQALLAANEFTVYRLTDGKGDVSGPQVSRPDEHERQEPDTAACLASPRAFPA